VQTIAEGALALAMIAAFTLAFFGVRLALGSQERKRGLLMIAAALVLVGNVLIWAL
jgi:high-affinity Fe2+/Pb2+ permease